MDLPEELKNDPHRKLLLQKIIDAHDNAIISHRFDANEELEVVYDKYSVLSINKLTKELRSYEQMKFPEIFMRTHPNCRSSVTYVDEFNIEREISMLKQQLKAALENEDFEKCEMLKNKIEKLKK